MAARGGHPRRRPWCLRSGRRSAPDHQNDGDLKVQSLPAGPMAVEEHWTYLRTDTGFHQTFWIAEWPRQKVFPGFLHPLIYVGDFRHTVTEVIRAVPTTEALRDIRSAQEAHETRRRINTRFDRPLTREQRAEEEEVAQREEEIVAGHGDVRPAAYVTITAATLEDLARHRQELESAAAGAFVELRLLAGQQWAAFVAGALRSGGGCDDASTSIGSVRADRREPTGAEGTTPALGRGDSQPWAGPLHA